MRRRCCKRRYGLNAWAALRQPAVALAALVGFAIGFLAFRAGLQGSYFALVTLAFAEVFRILANAWSVTGGAAGLLVKLQLEPGQFSVQEPHGVLLHRAWAGRRRHGADAPAGTTTAWRVHDCGARERGGG